MRTCTVRLCRVRCGVARCWVVLARVCVYQRTFLQTFTDDAGHNVYEPIIERMCASNGQVCVCVCTHVCTRV